MGQVSGRSLRDTSRQKRSGPRDRSFFSARLSLSVVGATGFEPVISCTQSTRLTGLGHTPTQLVPVDGFEPSTPRLSSECSTAELHETGCSGWTRTNDNPNMNRRLYQLSYGASSKCSPDHSPGLLGLPGVSREVADTRFPVSFHVRPPSPPSCRAREGKPYICSLDPFRGNHARTQGAKGQWGPALHSARRLLWGITPFIHQSLD